MPTLLEDVNKQFAQWVTEESRQLRIIEESAANLVAAVKTHPARKPHLKRLRLAQKALENASEQCIHFTAIADFLNAQDDFNQLKSQGDILSQLSSLDLNPSMSKVVSSASLLIADD